MANRTTQIGVEAFGASSPSNRVTQVAVEAFGPDDSSNRVTQVVVEILGVVQNECYTPCLGIPFLFTEAEWDATSEWYFEAYFRAVSGTALARLFD
ncbi:MAG: hypothetical protein ACYTFZ_07940, partial [Planctomycetota bacterium]